MRISQLFFIEDVYPSSEAMGFFGVLLSDYPLVLSLKCSWQIAHINLFSVMLL